MWTAGVANHPFFKEHVDVFDLSPKGGRVEVNEHLEGAPRIYVLGDNAATEFGGLAQTAINDANFVAKDLIARLTKRKRPMYRPKRPVTVTPVGEKWAIAEYKSLHLYGRSGWILRRIADLIGYMDIAPFGKAYHLWRLDRIREDDCKKCDKINAQINNA